MCWFSVEDWRRQKPLNDYLVYCYFNWFGCVGSDEGMEGLIFPRLRQTLELALLGCPFATNHDLGVGLRWKGHKQTGNYKLHVQCMCVCMYACVCMYVCMHVCMCICMYRYRKICHIHLSLDPSGTFLYTKNKKKNKEQDTGILKLFRVIAKQVWLHTQQWNTWQTIITISDTCFLSK